MESFEIEIPKMEHFEVDVRKTVDYLLGNTENKQTSDVLEDIELLFRMNSEGLTEDEKAVFEKELIEFMDKRRKIFDDKK